MEMARASCATTGDASKTLLKATALNQLVRAFSPLQIAPDRMSAPFDVRCADIRAAPAKHDGRLPIFRYCG
jgi:hypothetical protein